MALITVDKVSLAFGHHLLLDQVILGIEAGDKIGLIGRNGAGKSSLLKILALEIKPDDGAVYIAGNAKVIYVHQEPQLDSQNTIAEEIFSGLGAIKEHLVEYNKILDQMATDHSPELVDRLTSVQEILDHNNAWVAKNLVDKTISELNLNGEQKISDLSGGVRKKVAIAKALVSKPDILLLDEPTNHLDIAAIEWLEGVINNFNGSVILITHDRTFLDKTVNKILELDRGKVSEYPGSYAKYKEWKNIQLANEDKINHEFDKFLAQEEVWIRKGIEARRTRNEGRVRRLEQLRKIRSERRERVSTVNITLDHGNLSGKIVTELDKINVKFGDRKIIDNFSTTIIRGDKIGLIGPNGIGKSTLLKVILGELKPDSGSVSLGTKLEVAYFDQLREQLDDNATIQDVVSQGHDFIDIGNRRLHIATYLEEFLFESARFRSKVSSLSGGERNRLLLARLFSKPANVLVLDEPTNDLDIETLELLEEKLANYSGTVFLVSHDREFLDNVVTESYVFTGNGEIVEIFGGYSDYLRYKQTNGQNSQPSVIDIKPGDTPQKPIATASKQDKLSYKEKLELEQLPQKLQDLEKEQLELNNLLLEPDFYKKDQQYIQQTKKRIATVDEELQRLFMRWEELEERSK
ncbi:MAG: transporter ATP-binding protein [Burkholderiales bacterium]|jgi:ATP-binding cassette subfamily F protein uup|nr:transporter ATP-binding protein [Burkholderiales bacterium]